MSFAGALSNVAFETAMATRGRTALDGLAKAALAPIESQRRTLRELLAHHATTAFGREHGYGSIRDADDFRARVPILDYESLRPWIEREMATGGTLCAEPPLMFARTSGTTGKPKYAPVTAESLRRMKRAQTAATRAQQQAAPMFRGRILALGSPMREETLADGRPAGSATGLIYETMPAAVKAKYIIPPEVFAIADPELKQLVVTRLALQHSDITAVATANPSTLLRLRDVSRANWGAMLSGIADGTFAGLEGLPEHQRDAVMGRIRPDPARCRELEALARSGEPGVADLWPRLSGVVSWTGGSCALAAEAVRDALPASAVIMDAGYVASEFRGTVVTRPGASFGVPLLQDLFFEFAPVDRWDQGSRETLLLHQIEPGQDYQVIVSSFSGLARYQINDVVRAGEASGRTPTLAFVRKGRGVTSITGEKLTEDQVNLAIASLAHGFGLKIHFHLMLADERAGGYQAFLQAEGAADPQRLGAALDEILSGLNMEYADKRRSRRLSPPVLRLLAPGAAEAYRRHCVSAGQRDGQFKVLPLQTLKECRFDFSPFVEEPDIDPLPLD